MSLADIQARAQSKAGRSGAAYRARYFREAEQAKRIANLQAAGYIVPLSEWLGHNNGPPWGQQTLFLEYCWRKAHEDAWKAPSHEIAILRCEKAEALGLSYREYALEILERGRFADEEIAAKIKARRQ